MAHSFTWNGGIGDWSFPFNWTDLTDASGTLAPGAADSVTFPVWPVGVTVTSTGTAAQVSILSDVMLGGQFSFGAEQNSATLTFLPGATMVTGTGQGGSYVVSGAGATAVFGSLSAPAAITLSDHGSLLAGSIDLGSASINVDGTARMEIGTVGNEPDGLFRVDPGMVAKGTGFSIGGNIQNNGTIETTASAALTGSIGSASGGVLQIDAGATLALSGTITAGNTVDFAGAAGVLDLRNAALSGLAVRDFVAGDTILLPAGINAAMFTASPGLPFGGQLALSAGGTVVETLTLVGSYGGRAFPLQASGGGVALTTDAPILRELAWQGGSGAWQTLGNWADITSGKASGAASLPNPDDVVSIASTPAITVSGGGQVRSLSVGGTVALSGSYTADTLAVVALPTGSGIGAPIAGSVSLQGSMRAASATFTGDFAMSGAGTTFEVAGMLGMPVTLFALNGGIFPYFGGLTLSDHASARLGGLSMAALAIAPSDAPSITIDATSALEIGTTGSPAPGALSVDAGLSIDLTGTLSANMVNSGKVHVVGDVLHPMRVLGGVLGAGTIDAADSGAGNGLEIGGIVGAGQVIAMGGAADAVTLDAPGLFAGTIAGFAPGETIALPGSITAAQFDAGTPGHVGSATINLFSGATGVGSITLSGDYLGSSFHFNSGTAHASVTLTSNPASGHTLALMATSAGPFDWAGAGNWTDLSSGSAPATGPDGSIPVQLFGMAPFTPGPLGGTGTSASIEVLGPYTLAGTFLTGHLQVDVGGAWGLHSSTELSHLTLASGASLSASDAEIDNALSVSGAGASLTVAGNAHLGTASVFGYPLGAVYGAGTIAASGGASVRLGGLTLSSTSVTFLDFPPFVYTGRLSVDGTSTVEIGTAGGAAAGVVTVDDGFTITGNGEIAAAVTNNGWLRANAGDALQIDGAVQGNGGVTIAAGGTVRLLGGIGSGAAIMMADGGSTLDLGTATDFGAVIFSFRGTDVIQLEQSPDALDYFREPFGSGVLTWSKQGTPIGHLNLWGLYKQSDFILTPGAASTITLAAPCFATGTRIRTTRGEIAVEALAMGDVIINLWGEHLPVRWIGHRSVEVARHPRPWDVRPVRVAPGAFGPGQPGRALLLSPDHAVFRDGRLVPIRHLINGATIRQMAVPRVTYWHVELERHDVLLAEALACESYLDTGNRAAFANGGGAVQLHPDFARDAWANQACGTLVQGGQALASLQAEILARAEALGHARTEAPLLRALVGGRALAPAIRGRTWHLRLPAADTLRLRSRCWVPAHTRPGETDTRRLGVAIANPRLDGQPIALDDTRLAAGWAEPEADWRWTTGDAAIAIAGARMFSFDLALTGTYWEGARRARLTA